MDKLDTLLSTYIEKIFVFVPEVVTSLIILAIGMFAIKSLKKIANKLFLEKRIDPTFASFLIDVLIWSLRILLFVIIASKLGIQTSSFVAIVGAMSLAIGLSLQGSLSNFAGGVLIILFKPFRIGDIIEAQGETGKVLTIHIFSTQIQTYQNNIVYIPNGVLSNGKIKNISQNNLRRLEVPVQTSLVKNTVEFMSLLQAKLEQNDSILNQPKPRILIKELLDTKITYTVQAWVEHDNYNQVFSYILLESKKISDAL
ncbi:MULTISPECIES: mechanosensitive ion channel family protein [Myroides]|uniref:Mechanosensitive ion channel n=1 Tax=Myroides albus TaxID=2562892 RepID=A0A6I3LGY3_9FLAO|nr:MULTISPECIES: mechanosensitive ion channel domain-containing protein [Myroides]MTG96826.1 mechanosensitive ion channel [Myroides albus]MVX36931.1 mechanosensitive ion channel [Myroides sp. LoEW2-1]UVD78424.1 mechanosensitive ion channel [Myroides albus]